jgi:hypothetical protein
VFPFHVLFQTLYCCYVQYFCFIYSFNGINHLSVLFICTYVHKCGLCISALRRSAHTFLAFSYFPRLLYLPSYLSFDVSL